MVEDSVRWCWTMWHVLNRFIAKTTRRNEYMAAQKTAQEARKEQNWLAKLKISDKNGKLKYTKYQFDLKWFKNTTYLKIIQNQIGNRHGIATVSYEMCRSWRVRTKSWSPCAASPTTPSVWNTWRLLKRPAVAQHCGFRWNMLEIYDEQTMAQDSEVKIAQYRKAALGFLKRNSWLTSKTFWGWLSWLVLSLILSYDMNWYYMI